jgi:poly-gamma-glutamate synthesis protein (capsule biosynthesis protein)
MKALLLGDLSPTLVSDPLFEKGDISTLFNDTLEHFKNNDFCFVNLECSLTTSENKIKKFGPNLKAHPNTAKVLKSIGITHCGLSNNHIFDFGIEGAVDTLNKLDEAGIIHTGFGDNYEDSRLDLVIEKNGEKTAVIAVCEHEYSYAIEDRMGSRPFDEFETLEDIRAAKQNADRVIVIYHGGKEHCRYPSPRLVRAFRAMARAGADVVIGQHSHCIGCYEFYEGCHLLYGQGNFHFVKPSFMTVADSWHSSLAVKYDTKTNEIEFIPFVNTNEGGIEIAKGDEKDKIIATFNSCSEKLANGEWKKGWHEFCESVANIYFNNISTTPLFEHSTVIGHYLDCEAHTDVLREMYPTYNSINEK